MNATETTDRNIAAPETAPVSLDHARARMEQFLTQDLPRALRENGLETAAAWFESNPYRKYPAQSERVLAVLLESIEENEDHHDLIRRQELPARFQHLHHMTANIHSAAGALSGLEKYPWENDQGAARAESLTQGAERVLSEMFFPVNASAKHPHHVNEYLVDQVCGGAAEGGWYYNREQFLRCHAQTKTLKAANAVRKMVENRTEAENRERPSITSVTSRGRYLVQVENVTGRDHPVHQPVYE